MKEYKNHQVIIRFDPHVCIHAAECVHGLPKVFDLERDPWVNVEGATPEDIAEVIQRCPSGALSYEFIVK